MSLMRMLLAVFVLCLAVAPGLAAQDGQPGTTLQQEGFVPIDELPPQDQLPAAPLLVAAYVFVIVVLFVYLFSVARRLVDVQRQMDRLEGDIKRRQT